MADPRTTFLFSYMNEQRSQQLRSTTSGQHRRATGNTYQTDIQDQVNTFMGAVDYIAIPDKLDLKVSYTLSISTDSQPITFYTGSIPDSPYPEVKNQWERLEASAKYTFDKDMTRATLGPDGQMYARLLYSWERNSAMNWQNDIMQTYMANQTQCQLWLHDLDGIRQSELQRPPASAPRSGSSGSLTPQSRSRARD